MTSAVFIADADAELRDLYREFFTHHGWRVQTSEGGLECLSQMRRYSPHLLILDLELRWGGADGLLAVMRGDPGLARVPVVLTSTEASSEALSGLMSPPVVQALGKPFSLTVLLGIARSVLWHAQPISEGTNQGGRHADDPRGGRRRGHLPQSG